MCFLEPSDSLILEDLPIFSIQRIKCGCILGCPSAQEDFSVGPWMASPFCGFGLWVLPRVQLEMLITTVLHAKQSFE